MIEFLEKFIEQFENELQNYLANLLNKNILKMTGRIGSVALRNKKI